jgi:hypothetical protein
MKILHIQGISHPVLYPESLFCCLAFRAMPVAATIEAGPFAATTIASVYVSAKSRGAALLQRIKRSDDKTIGVVLFNVLSGETTYDLG